MSGQSRVPWLRLGIESLYRLEPTEPGSQGKETRRETALGTV
jgi:hypothetical protein